MNEFWKNLLIGMIYALAGLGFFTIVVLFYNHEAVVISLLVMVISIGVSYAACKL